MIETWTLIFWLVARDGAITVNAIDNMPTRAACDAVMRVLPALPLEGTPQHARCARVRPSGYMLGRIPR